MDHNKTRGRLGQVPGQLHFVHIEFKANHLGGIKGSPQTVYIQTQIWKSKECVIVGNLSIGNVVRLHIHGLAMESLIFYWKGKEPPGQKNQEGEKHSARSRHLSDGEQCCASRWIFSLVLASFLLL